MPPRRAAAAILIAGSCAAGLAPTPATGADARRCNVSEFASGELIVRAVSCRAAVKVLHRALAHPGCKPTAADATSGRGCNGTTRVGKWVCRSLFPGEGYDLRCRSGARRIHARAGG